MRVLPNKAKTQRFCHQPPFRGNRTTTAKRVAYLRYDMGTSAAHAEAPLPAAAAPEPMGRDRGGCPPRPPLSDPGGACQELSHAPIEPWWETNPATTPCQKLGMVSLRQVSFGKEEETRTLKPFVETLRVRIPPGKAGPAARSESCVVVGRPILRSVDSEVKGRVIEPRKYKTPGAFVVDTGGVRVRQLTLGPLSLPDPAGVEEHGQ